jgi:hypothetical protein
MQVIIAGSFRRGALDIANSTVIEEDVDDADGGFSTGVLHPSIRKSQTIIICAHLNFHIILFSSYPFLAPW